MQRLSVLMDRLQRGRGGWTSEREFTVSVWMSIGAGVLWALAMLAIRF